MSVSLSQYWFARRQGTRRNAIAPVHEHGRIVVGVFVAAMVFGAIAFLLFAMASLFLIGLLIFATVAVAVGGGFIIIARGRTDPQRSLEDYRKLGRDV